MMSQEEFDELDTHPSWLVDDLVRYEDSWLLMADSDKGDRVIRLIDSTSAVQSQLALIKISILVLLVVALLTYIISRKLVRYSLRDIKTIADTVGCTDINSLDEKISLPHLPADDEIQTIATAINSMTDTLHGQVSQMKRFVGNLSHEIKTPLMTMLSQIDLSLRKGDYQTGLERNRTSVQQMNELVTMMTELHQAEQGQMQYENVAIEPLLADITEQCKTHYSNKTIALTTAVVQWLERHTDPRALRTILRNLIENAYKYTPTDGVITITADESHLAVHNTGSSLTDEQIRHIREPLRQADSSKGQDQWFGLGLTLVQILVERLWYTIDVVSDESGVKFEMTLSSWTKQRGAEGSSTKWA